MRLSSLLNLGLIATGAVASLRTLQRRHAWESAGQRAYIVLDYDDVLSMSTRAGLGLAALLHEAHHHGATHVSLPELTLARLIAKGRLTPMTATGLGPHADAEAPDLPAPRTGQWHTFSSYEPALLDHVIRELSARVPGSQPRLLALHPVPVLAVAGDLPTLAELGLGFEAAAAAEAQTAGLGVVPRPVSFAWPEGHLVERTLVQAAGLPGAGLIAFEGDIILGHEMHLDATVHCLLRYKQRFAYFTETRHQKGDWFIAKRLAPHGLTVPSHYFTPAAMVPEDYHSAAHHWGMLARSRGVRLCYVNVFRRIHATAPLEGLHYLEHIKEELEGLGLLLDDAAPTPPRLPAPDRRTQAVAALAPAGAAALAASEALRLPEPLGLAVSVAAAAGLGALPYLDRPRGKLEQDYPPSYAPKLLALAGAAAAPAAAALSNSLPIAAFIQAGTAAAVAAFTTGDDYALRIETYRALNADWALPLSAVLLHSEGLGRWRWLGLGGLVAAWLAVRRRTPDLLGELDKDLPAGHTHHLSAAQRLLGDTIIAVGPRPGRKWAGLGLAGLAAAQLLRRLGQPGAAAGATLAATAANAMALAAFRRPERPLAQTVSGVGRSWAGFGAAALALAVVGALVRHRPAPGD
ncbi:MAG: hypothetical protein IT317_17725 [Anaerolineales bacterium]|nr:hypothetical protein [Anaerolineales bacterium]